MSWWSRAVSWLTTPAVAPGPTFDINQSSVPPEFFGLVSYETPIGPVARVSRSEAIQVPAVKRGRDLIAGTIGTLPFRLVDTDNVEHVSGLLAQPEQHRARSITMTQTVEDMLFEGRCWWWITEYDFRGYPAKVLKIDPLLMPDANGHIRITLPAPPLTQPLGGDVWTPLSGREYNIPPRDLILFQSPTDGVLTAGARAIRTWLKLAAAVDKYADEPVPSGFFTPKPEADPDEVDVKVFLSDWANARRERATGYVPAVVDYNTVQWNPEQLQLIEGRKQAVVEIAEVLGIDPEDLGISTTSRTYQNSQQRRIDMINDTLGQYVSAVQERLSMADVTPRGYRVLGDFNGFLRADDKTRFETYQLGVTLGIYGRDDIAAREGLPQPTFPMPASPAPAIEAPVTASNFDADDPHTFGFYVDPARNTFHVDTQGRTITGLAVPYGVAALRDGRRYQFSQGSLVWGEVSRVKLLMQHDRSQAVGRAVELWDRTDGLFCRFKIARTPEGDRALALAEDGVYDGLSIGLNNDAQFSISAGIHHSQPGNQLAEISLTPSPAFDDARVSAVVAEADNERNTMECQLCHSHDHTAESCPRLTAQQFDQGALLDAIGARFNLPPAAAEPPTPGREVINSPLGPLASASASVRVNEPRPYRFDAVEGTFDRGAHCFSRDLIASLQHHDSEAATRLDAFMGEIFAIAQADVDELNPNIQRPDLYVDQQEFLYPMYNAIFKGTLTEPTPFVVPKFATSSGLVGDHSAGVEPSAGALTTAAQTITPLPLSGKTIINREVWDQGGSPQLDTILWRQIVRAYYEGLEQYIQAQLIANVASITDITITTAAADAALEASITSQLSPLAYIRGGNRFRDFFVQVDLFKALVAAKDSNGRKLFPILNPQNATGTTAPFFDSLLVGGLLARPAWALEATGSVAVNSWLFDRGDVHCWASAPRKFTFDNKNVATVEVGVWGYKAFAITDFAGTRQVVYDPV